MKNSELAIIKNKRKIIDLSSKFQEKQMKNFNFNELLSDVKESKGMLEEILRISKDAKEEVAAGDDIQDRLNAIKLELSNCINENNKIKHELSNLKINMEEVESDMRRINRLNKEHIEFVLVSFLTIFFSMIGLLIFSVNGLYLIHPSIYILGILMGIGWGSTALVSIYKHRGDN